MTHSTLSEFIFGDLSTAQGRLRQARMARVGVFHDSTLTPLDPQAHEPIQITVRFGADIAVKTMTLYYTTDRSLPQPGVGGELPMQRIQSIALPPRQAKISNPQAIGVEFMAAR
jgi:hypothetical protein